MNDSKKEEAENLKKAILSVIKDIQGSGNLSSNNLSPFVTTPFSPTPEGGFQSANVLADTVAAYTANTVIQLESPFNASASAPFTYNGQAILPTEIYSGTVSAVVTDIGIDQNFQVLNSYTHTCGKTETVIVHC
jgi:hypothetical protein